MLTNEEMNMSIESMLEETLDYDDNQQPTTGTATTVVKSVQPNVIKSMSTPTTVSLSAGTKIKMIPSSQFVQLKSLPAQNKLVNYTLGKGSSISNISSSATNVASTSIGSIVKTVPPSSGQQVFTLKTPSGVTTQFMTAAAGNTTNASTTATAAAQPKYTVLKNGGAITMLQMSKNMPAAQPTVGSNMDLSNIIDMPIVFADNDGNFAEQQQQQQGDAIKTGK